MKIKSIIIEFKSDEPDNPNNDSEIHAKSMKFEDNKWKSDGPMYPRYMKLSYCISDLVKEIP